ncbi:unnamed protein product [Urochloa humidicola]
MTQRCGPPFDFDLNELPPPEDDDVANDASPAREPEPALAPVREPSPRDLLPPSPQDTLSSPQHDSLPLPASAPEPSTRDPVPAPVSEPSPDTLSSPQHDSLPLPASAPEPSTRDPVPSPVSEPSPHDPLAAPVRESSPLDPRPSPPDPLHPPSPVLDLEASLSSLDDDYDEAIDYDDADLPPPPPLPPFGLVPVAAPHAPSPSSVGTPGALPFRPDRDVERASPQEPFVGDTAARLSSPDYSAPRGLSSGTASSHRSRRRPLHSSYDARDDDAISKQRRVGSYDDDDARSSRSGSRRSELASPPHYEQGGGRHAPMGHGQPGEPPRNRRRRPQQGRGWEQPQGLRRGGQERPQAQQAHGPHSSEATKKVGYSSYYPLLSSGSYEDGRQGPEQEPINGNGGYQQSYHHQRREGPPSSRPRGREENPYYGRRSQAQGPPKAGRYQQNSREGQSLRPSSGARGIDDAGRPSPAQQPINGGAYQQRKAPHGGERYTDRPYQYHPYARDGGAFDRANGGHQGKREPPPNYEHRRRDNKQQRMAGGPARGRQYYGD